MGQHGIEAGIIDPVKVSRSALQNAASVASLILTTEAVVPPTPQPPPPPPPPLVPCVVWVGVFLIPTDWC